MVIVAETRMNEYCVSIELNMQLLDTSLSGEVDDWVDGWVEEPAVILSMSKVVVGSSDDY